MCFETRRVRRDSVSPPPRPWRHNYTSYTGAALNEVFDDAVQREVIRIFKHLRRMNDRVGAFPSKRTLQMQRHLERGILRVE